MTYSLNQSHLGFVGGSATLGIGPVTIAVFAIGVLVVHHSQALGFAYGGIYTGDVFSQERGHHLTGELLGHVG